MDGLKQDIIKQLTASGFLDRMRASLRLAIHDVIKEEGDKTDNVIEDTEETRKDFEGLKRLLEKYNLKNTLFVLEQEASKYLETKNIQRTETCKQNFPKNPEIREEKPKDITLKVDEQLEQSDISIESLNEPAPDPEPEPDTEPCAPNPPTPAPVNSLSVKEATTLNKVTEESKNSGDNVSLFSEAVSIESISESDVYESNEFET